jgi:hypothetical protein
METPTLSPDQAELRVRHALRHSASCTQTCNEALQSALSAKISDDPVSYAQKIAMAREAGAAAQQALSKLITGLDAWKACKVHSENAATDKAKKDIAALEDSLSQQNQLQE